jgi:hypothetical protein
MLIAAISAGREQAGSPGGTGDCHSCATAAETMPIVNTVL